MAKFVKIVCIVFCFGICNLRSETYNVITVSRDTTAASYNRLSEEEIRLVYAQLARGIISEVDIQKLIPEIKWSEQAENILKMPVIKSVNPDIPTIVVFNEAFFGQDKPLAKEEIDTITNLYKGLPNTYLYMNFLYVDERKSEYAGQIENSTRRYREITKEFKFPSFCFNKIQNYIMDSTEGPTEEQILLFNQTKILYKDEEVGYYNKSSFCDEYDKFLDEKLYYVIGDFNTKYLNEELQLPIACLTCYDIDVLSNEMYKKYLPKTQICAFSSNPSYSLPATLSFFNTVEFPLSNFYICADGHCIDEEDEESPSSIVCSKDTMYRLNGVFKYERLNLSLIKMEKEFSFAYKITDEQEDLFSFKNFHLTLD